MKVKIYSLKVFFFVLFLFVANYSLGQQASCKVIMPAIGGAYSGDCKKGLAQGKGIAQGIDHYEGQFSSGLPHGKGIYTWANGSFYQGQWVNGLKEGKGKMVYRASAGDSIVTGYWKYDNYVGKGIPSPFTIIRNLGVVRSNFRKISDSGNDVIIKIIIGGRINSDIEGFSMVSDSGEEYQAGTSIGIQNLRFPLEVKIRYRTWNQLHTSQSNVVFEFTIHDPGRWEVTLTN